MKRSIAAGILVACAFAGGYAFSENQPEPIPDFKQTETIPVTEDNPISI